MKISTKQKRFLIIWIIINTFALFVNKVSLEGNLNGSLPENGRDGYQTYILTNTWTHEGFWPFVPFIESKYYNASGMQNAGTVHTFNGLFYSYDLAAFMLYIALGFGIVFIPKLWKDECVAV
jgi:hypothetical protein